LHEVNGARTELGARFQAAVISEGYMEFDFPDDDLTGQAPEPDDDEEDDEEVRPPNLAG